jgi:hypothetical protein
MHMYRIRKFWFRILTFERKKEIFDYFWLKIVYSFFDHTGSLTSFLKKSFEYHNMISTPPVIYIFGNNLTTVGVIRLGMF